MIIFCIVVDTNKESFYSVKPSRFSLFNSLFCIKDGYSAFMITKLLPEVRQGYDYQHQSKIFEKKKDGNYYYVMADGYSLYSFCCDKQLTTSQVKAVMSHIRGAKSKKNLDEIVLYPSRHLISLTETNLAKAQRDLHEAEIILKICEKQIQLRQLRLDRMS